MHGGRHPSNPWMNIIKPIFNSDGNLEILDTGTVEGDVIFQKQMQAYRHDFPDQFELICQELESKYGNTLETDAEKHEEHQDLSKEVTVNRSANKKRITELIKQKRSERLGY